MKLSFGETFIIGKDQFDSIELSDIENAERSPSAAHCESHDVTANLVGKLISDGDLAYSCACLPVRTS